MRPSAASAAPLPRWPRARWSRSAAAASRAVDRRAGTQLTMRMFHYGGTASRVTEQSSTPRRTRNGQFLNVATVRGRTQPRRRQLQRQDHDRGQRGAREGRYSVVYGSTIGIRRPGRARAGAVEWDPFTSAIPPRSAADRVPRHHGRREPPRGDGLNPPRPEDHRRGGRGGEALAAGPGQGKAEEVPASDRSHLMVSDGQEVHPGDVLARSRARRPRPRTSRAACRESSSSSRRGVPRTRRSSRRSTGRSRTARSPRACARSSSRATTAR
jgi:hypothetical protein